MLEEVGAVDRVQEATLTIEDCCCDGLHAQVRIYDRGCHDHALFSHFALHAESMRVLVDQRGNTIEERVERACVEAGQVQ